MNKKAAAALFQIEQIIAGLREGNEQYIELARGTLTDMVASSSPWQLAAFMTVVKAIAQKDLTKKDSDNANP